MKRAMSFGAQVRADFELLGEAALQTKSMFDEYELITTHLNWICKGLDYEISVIKIDYDVTPNAPGSAVPGRPFIDYQ